MNRPTQTEQIKQALLAGETLNPVDAFKRFKCTRLAAVICRLKGQGWQFVTDIHHGNGVAFYRLPDGWRPPATAKTPDAKKPR